MTRSIISLLAKSTVVSTLVLIPVLGSHVGNQQEGNRQEGNRQEGNRQEDTQPVADNPPTEQLAESSTEPLTEVANSADMFSRMVPIDYSGYNANAIALSDWNNPSTITTLANAAKSIGAQTLRLPGGDTANYWDWNLGGIIAQRQPNTSPYFLPQELPIWLNYQNGTNATLANVAPLIAESDADPIWVVNMVTADLQQEIQHLLSAKQLGIPVNRVELGNELYFNLPNYTRETKTAAGYADKAKEWALAIKATPGLEEVTIAITGVVSTPNSDYVQGWWPALLAKTGSDGRSAIDVVDAFTLHPYYNIDEIGAEPSDIGQPDEAGKIARAGIARLRELLATPALHDTALDNEQVWITEHTILEDSSIVLGNSWLHALMMDMHTQEFLKDERTAVSIAHVLLGNVQWQALTGQDGSQIDGDRRGQEAQPIKTDPSKPFEPTATGLVLGKTADIFVSGTATLLHSGDASIAWRVQEGDRDTVSIVNADDRSESVALPDGKTWKVTTYTGDPWATVKSDSDLQVTVRDVAGGTVLTVDGFSKVIAIAQ